MTRETLVSCLMPTSGRRPFVPLAIDCFLRQDHAQRELIVIDDGDDPVADLIPDHPRISYERVSRKLTLGAKRNLACRRAAGEVLVHWDDDDWSAPWRISYQLRDLREHHADIAGLRELYFLRPGEPRAWRYRYPERGERPWVAGGTLCFTREAWLRHPFPELDVGEDTRFVWTARGLRVHAHADHRFYVATVHPGNTSVKRPAGRRWTEVPAAEAEALMGDDVAAYRAAASGRALQARVRPEDEHVTVSVPYFRCRDYVRQCVESLLAQTHRELTVVVTNDGDPEPPWDVLADIDDPRLVRFDLTRNRGRYFADQVVLQATRSPYLMLHDADDWSDPDLIERLVARLREDGGALAVSAAYRHLAPGTPVRVVPGVRSHRIGPRFEHRAHQVGVFRAQAVSGLGGFYAGFTIGYDTFLVNALLMTDRIIDEPAPLYHWRMRPESLTTALDTGLRSSRRMHARRELERMYRFAYHAFRRHEAGHIDRTTLTTTIRDLAQARVATAERAELGQEAARLAPLLGPPAERRPQRTRGAVAAPTADATALLAASGLPWSSWTITPELGADLIARLRDRPPRHVLEIGSGISTAVLAAEARRTGMQVTSLEHDPEYAERTRALLTRFGLQDAVDLRVAPLLARECADGLTHPWYDTALDGPFDFVFADAPPLRHGRGAVLFALEDVLATEWELWLDDAGREHERECIARWAEHIAFTCSVREERRGLAILRGDRRRPTPPRRAAAPAPHLVFWSQLDLRRGTRPRPDGWVEDRARTWLAFTLPSILAQQHEDFEYWLVCDPAGREQTEPLARCARDPRVRLVYADEAPAALRALPERDRYLLTRVDSDDLYAPGVAGRLAQHTDAPEFFQFNHGYACDLRTGEVRLWPARSSPFYAHVYGPELRSRERWSEPDHTLVRPRALELERGQFLVTFHGRNDSSRIAHGRGSVSGIAALATLGAFGLGGRRSLDAFAVTARGDAGWRAAFERAKADLGPLRARLPGAPLSLETAALFAALCELVAARRVLALGAGLGALVAARSGAVTWHAVARDEGDAEAMRATLRATGLRDDGVVTWDAHRRAAEAPYDVVLHDFGDARQRAATVRHALTATDPAGFLLLAGAQERPYAAELDRRLARLCADVHPEAEQLTRDASGRHARLLGRVLGPAA
ncbi:glycosyltransferase [Solirubrobacter ginsenosidimutans]|uniref:Glycosyltransferase n=1 Tax=Solirubrobacter ginsenosidimutans TaxID=490573 RepID=A0A9X3N2H6_9ACTN|nr:glycosyltransferase [Solirubrobacter ginsenosidimutans]MDA0165828.1 glycosyltransferase [Solirubrobacter ginsenosidimutans]